MLWASTKPWSVESLVVRLPGLLLESVIIYTWCQ